MGVSGALSARSYGVRRMIAFDLGILAALLFELERGLEEGHQQARHGVETCHHAGRLEPVEAPGSDEPPDYRRSSAHERLLFLFVGT